MLEFDQVRGQNGFEAAFTLPEGTIAGVFGEGSAQLMRLAAGLLRPREGRILLSGETPGAALTRQRLQYADGGCDFFPGQTPDDAAAFFEALYPAFDQVRFEELLGRFGIPRKRSLLRAEASEKLAARLALALSAKPELLILDGVWTRLTGADRTLLRELLFDELTERQLTVLADFAAPEEADALCDRFLLLRQGRLLLAEEGWALAERYCRAEFFDAAESALRTCADDTLLSLEALGPARLLTLRLSPDEAAVRFREAGLAPADVAPLPLAAILRLEGGTR